MQLNWYCVVRFVYVFIKYFCHEKLLFLIRIVNKLLQIVWDFLSLYTANKEKESPPKKEKPSRCFLRPAGVFIFSALPNLLRSLLCFAHVRDKFPSCHFVTSCLGFVPRSNSFAIEPSALICSLFSLSGLATFGCVVRSQIRSPNGAD